MESLALGVPICTRDGDGFEPSWRLESLVTRRVFFAGSTGLEA